MRFLLVVDHSQLAKAIFDQLSSDSHIVDHARLLSDAAAYVETTTYDMILLDIMLLMEMVVTF